MGLVLLRLSLAIALFVGKDALNLWLPFHTADSVVAILALVLALGVLTPIASTVGFLLACILANRLDAADVIPALLMSLNACALFLLGPGAYSLDARIYGRRVLVLPPSPQDDRPVEKPRE